jgi:hypothetical protein
MAVGAVLLVAGVIGLFVPVSISDGNSGAISCGSAIAPDSSGAKNANDSNGANIPILNQLLPHTDFVAQCNSSVHSRQMWTIPLAVIGLLGITGALLVRRTEGAARTL